MATGIVSLAAHFIGHEYIAQALLGRPAAKAAQVLSSHIVADMYAKPIRSMPPEEAVTWLVRALTELYG